jgi:membrane protein involved in colicin uptake
MIERLLPKHLAVAAMVAAAVFTMVVAPEAAWADKRVALIIGNSSYQTVPQLPNPSRDASSVAKLFRDAGFDAVDLVLNVGNLDFKRAIRKFENVADQADIAVVYYAGHGLEIGGTNYLIPVDARLASDRDADDEAIPLERLVSSADGARRLRLIMLDACRDNPFVAAMRRERKTANRAVNGGLGRVEPTSTDTLIAYAAKAGSTADDGDGDHSPFTTAVLKNLTVPGLDVRLAFGRVRDEVLKATGNRQEPFVYGSLGGGNVSLVPAPVVAQPAPDSDVKADYELVQKIGSKRAWEVFLNQHPKGFYAELARAQIEALDKQVAVSPPPPANVHNTTVAALPPEKTPQSRETPSREAIEWDRVKEATDPTVLQKFIKRFPDSPLALDAQQRIDVLKRAQQEREEQARAAAAEAQRKAAAAAEKKKREDDERRAREAEAAEKAKAAAAELAAQRKREQDERRAAAAEAERQAKAAEAARKAQEAQEKAEQAARAKAAAEAAAAAAAAEKQAKEAEAARKKAEAAAAKEAICKDEQGKLEAILAKGSEGTGVDDLKNFSRTVTCERLGPVVVASIDRFNAEAAKRAATQPNSPQLVRSAQVELVRLGCLATTVTIDGTLNAPSSSALSRYLGIEGQPTDKPIVTQELVSELTKHATRVCPIECKTGETLKGEVCVADQPALPALAAQPASATAARSDQGAATPAKKDQAEDKSRRKQANRISDQDQSKRQKAGASATEAPRARQQALARPSIISGGGGGGSHTMIGVGF